MCFLLLAVNQSEQYPFILAANRDEFYQRPTASMSFWKDQPHILGGRDLEQGGTWMAVTNAGKFAAITNYREVNTGFVAERSRGLLVTDYLNFDGTNEEFITQLQHSTNLYAGYNLIFGQPPANLYYFSNRQNADAIKLAHGYFALSNHLLDTPWPKVSKGKQAFQRIIHQADMESALLQLLKDKTKAPDHELPDTGIEKEFEQLLSSIYIESENYGTRCSSVLSLNNKNELRFVEISHRGLNSDKKVINLEFK